MAFTNNINKATLRDALTNWVLGTDCNQGSIEYVMDEIPWKKDIGNVGFDYWGTEVENKIIEAIGSRFDCGQWSVARLVNFANSSNEYMEYRTRFQNYIAKKVEDIYNTYQEAIDKLNGKKELYYWVFESEGITERSKKTFSSSDACYDDMRQAANNKVLWNIVYNDLTNYIDNIAINLTNTRDEIICKSKSGTYTWRIVKGEQVQNQR